jgi:hypothetical protein
MGTLLLRFSAKRVPTKEKVPIGKKNAYSFYTFHFGSQMSVFLNQLVDIIGFFLLKIVQSLVVDIGHNMPSYVQTYFTHNSIQGSALRISKIPAFLSICILDMPGPDNVAVKFIHYNFKKASGSVIGIAFRIKGDGFRIFDGQTGHHITQRSDISGLKDESCVFIPGISQFHLS